MRDLTSTTVSFLLGPTQLENNRYYIKSIAEVIQFLVVNELSLRGTFCTEMEKERNLFTNLFEYTMKKDNKLQSIACMIPGNASYTFPEIQNEIIQIMAKIVQDQISKEIQNSNAYSILADSTRDKQNHEDLAIGARYIDITGKPVESCFSLVKLEAANAKSIANAILNKLNTLTLNLSKIVCQSYDGTAVMSGCTGGVQKLISENLNRNIPYIHCFNHQLHLAVLEIVDSHTCIKFCFDLCEQLCFFGDYLCRLNITGISYKEYCLKDGQGRGFSRSNLH